MILGSNIVGYFWIILIQLSCGFLCNGLFVQTICCFSLQFVFPSLSKFQVTVVIFSFLFGDIFNCFIKKLFSYLKAAFSFKFSLWFLSLQYLHLAAAPKLSKYSCEGLSPFLRFFTILGENLEEIDSCVRSVSFPLTYEWILVRVLYPLIFSVINLT